MDDFKSVNLVDKYLKYPLLLLHICGLWRRGNNPLVYYLYAFAILFPTQCVFTFCSYMYMSSVWGDIAKVAEASFFLLTQTIICIKVTMILWNSSNIKRLIQFMNSSTFAPTRAAHLLFINSTSSLQRIEFFVFLFFAASSVTLWTIFPMLDPAEKRILPFKTWLPFPIDKSPYYELVYIYQISSTCISALVTAGIDRLSISMTALSCAQVQILKDNLVNIEQYAILDLEKSLQLKYKYEPSPIEGQVDLAVELNAFRGNYIHSRQFEIEAIIQRSLVKSILHHRSICRFMCDMEQCFRWGVLFQFAVTVLTMCITGLQITLVNPISLQFLSIVTYMGAVLTQIYFMCRVGTELTIDSGDLVLAAYSCPWIERKTRFHTSLLIFMERLKQPIVPRAGYLFPLSLSTFVSILRSSYSYFAVLEQLNSKK